MASLAALVTPVMAVLSIGAPGEPELLWDTRFDRVDNAHAISPPGFPNIRQADDLYVDGEGWLVTEMVFRVIEDESWKRGETLQVFLYGHDGQNLPRGLKRVLTGGFEPQFTGKQMFARDVYDYWVRDAALALERGGHWLGPRNPDGAGVGTNYWLEYAWETPCQGVDDACETFPNASSLDNGQTWHCHCARYHFLFKLFGYHARTALPESFEVTRGTLIEGDVDSLAVADDDRMAIEARAIDPVAELVLEGTSPLTEPPAIGFSLEAHANRPGITETIELWDFAAGEFIRLHEAEAALEDRRIDVAVIENARDFVEPGTRRLRARIGFNGPPADRWTASTDLAVWRIAGECPGDVDEDSDVDFQDLLTLLASWGPCMDCEPCESDLDDDCDVDFQDLLALLANWGACTGDRRP